MQTVSLRVGVTINIKIDFKRRSIAPNIEENFIIKGYMHHAHVTIIQVYLIQVYFIHVKTISSSTLIQLTFKFRKHYPNNCKIYFFFKCAWNIHHDILHPGL